MGIITISAAFVDRRMRQRLRALGATESTLPNILPDLTGVLYLTILVLVGARSAIVFAILTPFIARLPEIWHDSRAIFMALRQSMSSSVTLLAAGFAYASVSAIIPHVPTALRAHVVASFAASAVFLVGVIITRFLLAAPAQHDDLVSAIRAYLTGPALLFQILLLCCVPLLPLTETLQTAEIEFAWALLLPPMGAVYYLALTIVRLRQQSDTLHNTYTELTATRLRETQLKSYAALITRAQEDERRRLARELHDDTMQALIALSRGLDALSNQHINPISAPEDVLFIEKLVKLTHSTLDSVRRACQDLRPSVLDDLGLAAALDSLAGNMTERGLRCEFIQRGAIKDYPPEVEVAVYRIAQEALSNALRYSDSQKALVELTYRSDGLRLVVADDGRGFDVSGTLAKASGGASYSTASDHGAGLGLMGMRERATLIGATLDIQSARSAGTRITLLAPINGAITRPLEVINEQRPRALAVGTPKPGNSRI
jgi:signal transduction histidine kinase